MARMRAEVDHPEYVAWGVYFARDAQRKELANRKVG